MGSRNNGFFYSCRFGTLTIPYADPDFTFMNDVVTGATYRHYKQQRLYRVLTLALLEANKQELVIYECLYPNDAGPVWARPKDEFLADIQTPEYRGPRFTRVPAT